MNKYRKLASNSILFAIGGFSSKILAFFLVPLYSTYLSAEEFGAADIVITTVNVLFPVISLSLSDAVLRLLYDTKYKARDLLRNAFTEMYISLAALSLVILINHFTVGYIDTKFLIYGVLLYLFNNISSVLNNYLKANDKVRALTIAGIVNTTLTFLFAILFIVVLKKGLDGYLISLIVSSAIGDVILLCFCRLSLDWFWPSIEKSVLTDMLRFAIPIIPSTIAWWINTSADKYMITLMISASANGMYSMAHKLPSILTVLASFFCSAWQLSIIDNIDKPDNRHFINQMYEAYCLICFIVCSAGIASSRYLGIIFLRGEFFDGYNLMPMLFVATVFSSITGFLGSISIAKKETKNLAKSTTIGAVVNILLNLLLISMLGTNGAAIATAISFLIITIIRAKPFVIDRTFERTVIVRSALISLLIFLCAVLSLSFNQLMIPIGSATLLVTVVMYRGVLGKIIKIIPKKGGSI